MAIGDEKVWLQLAHVQRDLSDTVCAVDHTQDTLFPADSNEALKGKAHPGIADNSIKHSSTDLESLVTSLADHLAEPTFELIPRDGILKCHFPGLERSVLLQ